MRNGCTWFQVAEAVRELWAESADIKGEISDEMKALAIASPVRSGNGGPDGTNSLAQSKDRFDLCGAGSDGVANGATSSSRHMDVFAKALSSSSERILSKLMKSAAEFLDGFLSEHAPHAIREMCTVCPTHERVSSLAAHLIEKQIRSQHASLLKFICSYAQRKLEEVHLAAVKQFGKSWVDIIPSSSETTVSLSKLIIDSAVPSNVDIGRQAALLDRVALRPSSYGDLAPDDFDQPFAEVEVEKQQEYIVAASAKLTEFVTFRHHSTSATDFCSLQNRALAVVDVLQFAARAAGQDVGQRGSAPMDVPHNAQLARNIDNVFRTAIVAFSDVCKDVVGRGWSNAEQTSRAKEAAAKLRIFIVKLFTVSLPCLLFLDAIASHDGPSHRFDSDSGPSPTPMPMPSPPPLVSGTLVQAMSCGLVSLASASRILVATSRDTTISYYENCLGLKGLQATVNGSALSLVGRVLKVVCGGEGPGVLRDIGESVEADSRWFKSAILLGNIKKSISSELCALIVLLTKRLETPPQDL